jgi:tRNA G37 N-methylase Trm5
VFVPTQGSYLVWKYLFREGIGRGRRCLDVGCGTGLQSVQLARNGASHVHAIDVDERAAQNTLTNAFRNGVADRVTAAAVDLFPWVPEERYDVIVASLYQTPVDPFDGASTHRPLDYWGRNLIDHLIAMLPAALLDRAGFASRVVDFGFFEYTELFQDKEQQIHRVEQLSDAYHLRLGDQNVIVAYLIEVTRGAESEAPPA